MEPVNIPDGQTTLRCACPDYFDRRSTELRLTHTPPPFTAITFSVPNADYYLSNQAISGPRAAGSGGRLGLNKKRVHQ